MEKQYSFFDLIIEVFEKVKKPMTPEEVWEKAVEFSFDKKLGSSGKTPAAYGRSKIICRCQRKG